MTPKRIQRKRTKGWRMPDGAVYVGRPTKWGNPYVVGSIHLSIGDDGITGYTVDDANRSVALYEEDGLGYVEDIEELRGKDLACWCPLDQPCHADVLLEWANA